MPFLDLAAIKREIPLQKVLDHIGWQPIAVKDDEQRGKCPLHHSKNAKSRSFAVKGEGWYCHTCKDGGDVLRFWAKLKQLTLYKAALELCRMFGVTAYHLPRIEWPAARRNGEEER